MIDRYLVRYFLAVIDQGNFSKAAAFCRVSQPTLSVGIAKLEREIGLLLFNRSNRRIEVTAAGARFTEHARRIEAAFRDAEKINHDEEPRPLFRIGVLSTLPGSWLETALSAVRRQAPLVRLEIFETSQKDLLALLNRGRIDAAIGVRTSDHRRYEPFLTESYRLAVSAEHPLATKDSIEGEALGGEAMIVRRHCEALSDTSRYFTRRGVRPFMAARTVNDERALGYVRAGLAITVIPQCLGGPDIATPALAGFDLTRSITMLVAPDNTRRVERMDAFKIMHASYAAFPKAIGSAQP